MSEVHLANRENNKYSDEKAGFCGKCIRAAYFRRKSGGRLAIG
jgi:hypothetical protein